MMKRPMYLDLLKAYKDQKLIKVITGVRRCGKSTLLLLFKEYLEEQGIEEMQIIHMNFEFMKFNHIHDYQELYTMLTSLLTKDRKYYILLDEIQIVNEWEKCINSLSLEYQVDMYLTGSNAYLLSSELSTFLAGRYVEIKMLPLSFKEYLEFNKDKNYTKTQAFEQYVLYGGFPQVCEQVQIEKYIDPFLSGIYDTIVLKDIVARNKIRNVEFIDRIVKFTMNSVGSLISTNKVNNYLKSNVKEQKLSNHTISDYLKMLENAFILYKAERFDVRGKDTLQLLNKYYVVDTGIRNTMVGYQNHDIGHMIENVIYFELLRRGFHVYTGKFEASEIDFVAIKPHERKYYQISLSIMDEHVKKRELAPLLAISDNYEKVVLTMDSMFLTGYEGIRFQNIIDFLLEDYA